MNNKEFNKQLLEIYESGDIERFNEVNEKYNMGLSSIEDIKLVEDRPIFNLDVFFEGWDGQYMKNYTTSRLISNIEPDRKYKLKEPVLNVISYSYMIFHVLTQLQVNPNIDEVLDNVELQISSEMAKDILISEGFVEEIGDGYVEITDYGFFRLGGVNWVSFYDNFLDYFDFDDFERYMKEYDTGSVVKNCLNYLDENLKVAYEDKDFYRLHDVFSSKAMVYLNSGEFKNALLEELKLFVLKLNPVFLDEIDCGKYLAIEYPNINNIIELNDLSDNNNLKKVLYRAWFEIDLGKMLMTKKEAFNYLSRAFDSEVLNDLSREICEKYFNK